MYSFCTYFDRHYLDKGLACYHSLVRHCLPFQLWILCMDEVTHRVLTDMQLPYVHLISLSDFEKDNSPLLQAKQNRSLIEYYFTCTPSLPLYVLDLNPGVDIITYLDADLFFFSSIEPVYQELGTGSILIISHRFPPELEDRKKFGIYNVGMLSFRRDHNGLACLHWWQDRCREWCYDRIENGRFADQKYLDDFPDRFFGVVILQHKGTGLAPWNLANYHYSQRGREFLIDGQTLIMYHFHGLTRVNQWIYDTNVSGYKTRLPKILKNTLYIPYIQELGKVDNNLSIYPGGNFNSDKSIRVSDKKNISLKTKISQIFEKGLHFISFFKKWVTNDLIFLLCRNPLFKG